MRFDLVIETGASLRGRVLDTNGQPMTAKVWDRCAGSGKIVKAFSDVDGHYEIGINEEGLHLIYAGHDGKGVLECLSIFLDPATDMSAPDLVLRGPGAIDGVVVYPDGIPVANLWLQAVAVEGTELQIEERLDRASEDHIKGLIRGTVKTNAHGRFHFSGLKPGRYYIMDKNNPNEAYWQKDHESYLTGDTNVTVVRDFYRVRLRVLDEEGRPVPGAQYWMKQREGDEWLLRIEGNITDFDATKYLRASPGETLLLQASAETAHRTEACVVVEEGIYETAIDLVLALPEDMGLLKLAVIDEEDRPVQSYSGRLVTPDTNVIVRRIRDDDTKAETPLSVPEGRYILHLQPGKGVKSNYLPIEKEVEVLAGRETEVTVRARMGGRIRLNIEVPEDRAGEEIKLGRSGSYEVHPIDGSPPVKVGLLMMVILENGILHTSSITPDQSPVTPLLEPGPYTVYFNAEGYQPFVASAIVKEGRVVDVKALLISE